MLCFPNCKINLGLYVTDKRGDGYHNLETVFYPIPIRDTLEIVPSGTTAIHLSGKAVAGDEKSNLVWKAYELMRKEFGDRVPELDIYLHKTIPMGAGMGGGSADGAFMISLIDRFCKLELDKDALAQKALELGSDCPFFIYNTPQFARGRGEELTPLDIDLSTYSIQVVSPEVYVSTAKAFSLLKPGPASFDLRKLPEIAVVDWKDQVGNDFEKPVFSGYPVLADIKAQLYHGGALYASMSGSGSAIYGIMPKKQRVPIRTDISTEIFYIE